MAEYSVPEQSRELFLKGILENPLIKNTIPSEAVDFANTISFEGTNAPSIPINWRFAESISALKACEAAVVAALLKRRYGVEPPQVRINTYGPNYTSSIASTTNKIVTMPNCSSCPLSCGSSISKSRNSTPRQSSTRTVVQN